MSITSYQVERQHARTDPEFDAIISTPVPKTRIGIHCNQHGIVALRFLTEGQPCRQPSRDQPFHALLNQLLNALQHYFKHPETPFSLPLATAGTPFQRRVWQAISAIPCGQTRSYAELARQLNTSARAVGGACRANLLPILIPCHRVIAANGGPGGFLGQTAGNGMAANLKQWLLQHEAMTGTPAIDAQ